MAKSVSKRVATKGRGRLKKGFRFAKGGRIVKAKSKRGKSTGAIHSCAVRLGRRGGKKTAARRRR